MKNIALILLGCLLLAFPAAAQLCPGGGVDFSSAVTFDPAWIYGCNTGTSCNGGVSLSNRVACQPTAALDACAPAPSCGTASNNASNVWFKFYATGTTAIISCFQNSSFVIGIQAFSGGPACGSLTEMGCALAGGPSSGVQLHLSGLTPGGLYYFRIFGSSTPVSQRSGIYCFCGTTGLSSTLLASAISGFSGQPAGSAIALRWEAPAAGGNDMFELERSTDGISFITIARVPGAGAVPFYAYTDTHPAKGNNYYRVRQVSPGAQSLYSVVVLVRQEAAKAFSLQVDASRRELLVAVDAPATVILYDAGGRALPPVRLRAGNNTLPLGQLPAGIYFIRSVQSGGTQKFYLSR